MFLNVLWGERKDQLSRWSTVTHLGCLCVSWFTIDASHTLCMNVMFLIGWASYPPVGSSLIFYWSPLLWGHHTSVCKVNLLPGPLPVVSMAPEAHFISMFCQSCEHVVVWIFMWQWTDVGKSAYKAINREGGAVPLAELWSVCVLKVKLHQCFC